MSGEEGEGARRGVREEPREGAVVVKEPVLARLFPQTLLRSDGISLAPSMFMAWRFWTVGRPRDDSRTGLSSSLPVKRSPLLALRFGSSRKGS